MLGLKGVAEPAKKGITIVNVEFVNPFISSFGHVMKQLGFSEVKNGALSVKGRQISCTGIVLVIGVLGNLKGNIVYVISYEDAKKIASTMMMGMPVDTLDDMAKSSLSELSNMLSANAATNLSSVGVLIDISTPTLLDGEEIGVTMSSDQVLCVQLLADGHVVEVNISFDKTSG